MLILFNLGLPFPLLTPVITVEEKKPVNHSLQGCRTLPPQLGR